MFSCWCIINERNFFEYGICYLRYITCYWWKENQVTSCLDVFFRRSWNKISSSWDKNTWNEINLVQIYEWMVFMLSIIWKEFHIIETWFAFINVFGCIVIWSPCMDWHEFYLLSSKWWDPWDLSITMASLCCDGRLPLFECNT
jgi:hypothetical protein